MQNGRQLDSAVIGALQGVYDLIEYNISMPFGSASSPQIAATIQQYNNYFCGAFAINSKLNGTAGMLYGRYKGDTYGGG